MTSTVSARRGKTPSNSSCLCQYSASMVSSATQLPVTFEANGISAWVCLILEAKLRSASAASYTPRQCIQLIEGQKEIIRGSPASSESEKRDSRAAVPSECHGCSTFGRQPPLHPPFQKGQSAWASCKQLWSGCQHSHAPRRTSHRARWPQLRASRLIAPAALLPAHVWRSTQAHLKYVESGRSQIRLPPSPG